MAQKNITDAGVGRALFTTKVQLAWQAAKMCFLVAAVLFVTPLSIGLWRITPENLDLVRLDLIARFDDSGVARRWYLRRGGSDRGAEEASQEGAQSGGWAEGNADADRWQEGGERGCGEEAGGQTATQIGLTAVPSLRFLLRALMSPDLANPGTTPAARGGSGVRNPR